MVTEVLYRLDGAVVRRLRLEAGEATSWHCDPFRRVTVVVHGSSLEIESRDGSASVRLDLRTGQVDVDEPLPQMHRAVNVGARAYEEIAIFFVDATDAVLQPEL